jgi:tetratricopeptide (TPR) repeat protein
MFAGENDDFERYIDLAALSIAGGQFEQAIEFCNISIKLESNCYRAYFYRGMAYAYMKDNERAINNFNEAIRLNSNAEEIRTDLEKLINYI